MAKKTIKYRLSVSDMLRLAKELDGLQKDLERKCKEFCLRLAERNMEVTKAAIDGIDPSHKDGGLSVEVKNIEGSDGKYRATVRMSGEQCAFVEFGAGILLIRTANIRKMEVTRVMPQILPDGRNPVESIQKVHRPMHRCIQDLWICRLTSNG